jgi:hypothetical protein
MGTPPRTRAPGSSRDWSSPSSPGSSRAARTPARSTPTAGPSAATTAAGLPTPSTPSPSPTTAPASSPQHQRAAEGCSNVAHLFREISALGYDGSYSTVHEYFDQHRPAAAPLTPPPPTIRDVTGWLTRHPDSLTEDEQPQLKALLERCPELHAASGHVRTFARMLTQLNGQDLPQWISDARAAELPGISSFAKGLEQDLDAVTQGLTSRWNSGPVEGRVNHIKIIKRQMFGRAGLLLPRKRILLTVQRQ